MSASLSICSVSSRISLFASLKLPVPLVSAGLVCVVGVPMSGAGLQANKAHSKEVVSRVFIETSSGASFCMIGVLLSLLRRLCVMAAPCICELSSRYFAAIQSSAQSLELGK